MKKYFYFLTIAIFAGFIFLAVGCQSQKKLKTEPLNPGINTGSTRSTVSTEGTGTTSKTRTQSTYKKSTTKKKSYRQYKSVAVQCSGYTKKGRRCKRKTTHASGYCWQHR